MELEFHAKARLLKSALSRLHDARIAHKTANKVYNDAKVWRYDADPEAYQWEQKSLERLQDAVCELKSAEAEIRQIKLARITDQ